MRNGSRTALAKLSAKKLATLGLVTLAVANDQPPSEFRIFRAGWNDTENGRFLFDEKAAQAVMAAYTKWGVDVVIDLEHQMLDEDPSPDPTAKDARGWCKLELRDSDAGPELWAVDVKWTEDGAARLTQKRQRYISPAFAFDKKTKRVEQIVNVAITSIPATHGAQELVAAAKDLRKLSTGPSFGDVSGAIQDALKARMPSAPPDYCSPWLVDIFDASAVFQMGATYYEVSYTYANGAVTLGEPVQVTRSYTPVAATPAPDAASTDTNASAQAKKKLKGAVRMNLAQFLKVCKALGLDPEKTTVDEALAKIRGQGDPDALTEDAPPPAGDGGSDENAENSATAAASVSAEGRLAMQATGLSSPSEAMAELSRRSKIAVDFEAREAQLAKDREKLELDERTNIVKELQKLGAETPHTSGLAKGKLCDRLAKEPIAELRARRDALLAAKGGKVTAITPPIGEASPSEETIVMKTRTAWGVEGDIEITPAEQAKFKGNDAGLASYARTKLGMKLRSVQKTV